MPVSGIEDCSMYFMHTLINIKSTRDLKAVAQSGLPPAVASKKREKRFMRGLDLAPSKLARTPAKDRGPLQSRLLFFFPTVQQTYTRPGWVIGNIELLKNAVPGWCLRQIGDSQGPWCMIS